MRAHAFGDAVFVFLSLIYSFIFPSSIDRSMWTEGNSNLNKNDLTRGTIARGFEISAPEMFGRSRGVEEVLERHPKRRRTPHLMPCR